MEAVLSNMPTDKATLFAEEIEDLLLEARNYLDGEPIANEDQASAVSSLLNRLRRVANDADDARKDEKRPHDEATKAVQGKWKPILDKADLAATAAKQALAPWLQQAPGKYGEYIEGWRVIDEANRIFGFDGWTRETVDMIETNRELKDGKHFVGYRCKVRVTVLDHESDPPTHVVREGSAFGSGVSKNLGDAVESAVKEAETDAMKRALMTFGNPFGLALYDKSKANVGSGEEFVTDSQRDLIQTTAAAAGVTLQAICKAYNISSLTDLPADLYETVMESLRLTIEKKAKQPEKVAA
jgi:DNA repair and recombination protein RAD52